MIELKCKINLSVKKPQPKSEKEDEAPIVKGRGKVPRISRLMALAIRMDEMLRRGEAQDTFELAELGKVSQPRVTQILSLSLLAPDIQEALLSLPRETSGKPAIHERNLRPIATEPMWDRNGRFCWNFSVQRMKMARVRIDNELRLPEALTMPLHSHRHMHQSTVTCVAGFFETLSHAVLIV